MAKITISSDSGADGKPRNQKLVCSKWNYCLSIDKTKNWRNRSAGILDKKKSLQFTNYCIGRGKVPEVYIFGTPTEVFRQVIS